MHSPAFQNTVVTFDQGLMDSNVDPENTAIRHTRILYPGQSLNR